jgi:transcriptional regulator with GAF, ATPase, and Fis domain
MPDPSRPAATLLRLLDISRELSSAFKLSDLLPRILDAAIEVTGAERGFVCLAREGDLTIASARNLDHEEVRDAQQKLSQSIVQQVLASGQPMVSLDASVDSRLAESRSIHDMKIRSVACIPLKLKPSPFAGSPHVAHGSEVVGCVYLDHRFRPAQFVDADIELLELFGAHAALALRNAELMEMLEARNAQLNEELADSARELVRTRSLLRSALADSTERYQFPGIVYASRAMHELLGLVKRVADEDLPILITGESGTGKERLARAIHALSPRSRGPFVAVNCGAIPPELFESEFFGHRRGAFTGADRDRPGLMEAAHHGTLFLDEVADLPLPQQVKLLRALQEGEVRRVGEDVVRPIDIRVLSACNKDLEAEVNAGRFREDLFYRLRVFHVEIPPLRERPEDIPLLVDEFARYAMEARTTGPIQRPKPRPSSADSTARPAPAIDPEVYTVLANYSWPGNIRELENEVRRSLALGKGRMTLTDLSPRVTSAPRRDDSLAALRGGGRTLEDILGLVEREVIVKTLEKHQGNKSKTAQELGI